MDSASAVICRRSSRQAAPLLCVLAALMALGLAGPAAAQAPDVERELAAALPELSVDPSFDPSTSGGVPAMAEPVAPVEPVTPGSSPAPAAGGAQAPPAVESPPPPPVPSPATPVAPPAVESAVEAAPPKPAETAPAVEKAAEKPGAGGELPLAELAAPYPPPTYLNLDIRILSPGDNGAVNQSGTVDQSGGADPSGGVDQSGGVPGLSGGTNTGAGVPEDWTWNWNWGTGDCGAGAGPSTAGWTWNWNWGCQDLGVELSGGQDGRLRNVLEWVADPLSAAPPEMPIPGEGEFGALAGFDDADEAPGLTRASGGAPSDHQRLEGGSTGSAAAAAQFALVAPVAPLAPAPLAARSAPSRQVADPARSDDRASQDGGGGLDPFPFPAPLAAQTAAGSGAGNSGGGGGALLLLAALIGGLALIPPPPGGRVHAWQQRLRSLLSSSRLERPG